MSRAKRLTAEFQAAFEGEPWYGPGLATVLDEVPASRIHEHPVQGGHSIAELLAHMAHWKDVVRRRLEGDAVPDANDTDWPVLEPDTATFRALRQRLEASHVGLTHCLAALTDAQLDGRVAGNDLSREGIVQGVLQHDIYHTGQLALLVKALRGG
jgi:uncharacterized damage-inducible protein DinB